MEPHDPGGGREAKRGTPGAQGTNRGAQGGQGANRGARGQDAPPQGANTPPRGAPVAVTPARGAPGGSKHWSRGDPGATTPRRRAGAPRDTADGAPGHPEIAPGGASMARDPTNPVNSEKEKKPEISEPISEFNPALRRNLGHRIHFAQRGSAAAREADNEIYITELKH